MTKNFHRVSTLPYKSEILLTKKQIDSIFLSHFPQEKIVAIQELTQSFINPVYNVTLNNSQDYILKINNPRWSNKQKRELFAMELARKKTSIPIPEVFISSFDKLLIPYDYMIQEKILGVELRANINSSTISENELLSIIEKLGEYLGELHSIKFDFFGDFTHLDAEIISQERSKRDKFWNTQFLDWRSCFKAFCYDNLHWVDTSSFPQYRKKIISKIEDYSQKVYNTESACFVHSDIQPSNILIDENKITGIIDFEWSFAGSASFEYALVLAGLCFSSFPSLEQSTLFSSFYGTTVDAIKKCFSQGYQTTSKELISEEPEDLTNFIWLLFMIGSCNWSVKSSTADEVQDLEKSIHNLFKQLIE